MRKNARRATPSITMNAQSVATRFRQIEQGEKAFALCRIQSLKEDIGLSDLSEPDKKQHIFSLTVMEFDALGRCVQKLTQRAQEISDQETKNLLFAQAAKAFQEYLALCKANPSILESLGKEHESLLEYGEKIHKLCDSQTRTPITLKTSKPVE